MEGRGWEGEEGGHGDGRRGGEGVGEDWIASVDSYRPWQILRNAVCLVAATLRRLKQFEQFPRMQKSAKHILKSSNEI